MTKAKFCLVTGVPPSEYDSLAEYEIWAFYQTHKQLNK